MSVEELFDWARKFKITVVYENLCKGHLGKADADKRIVTLDFSLLDKPRELKCVLAEEIGHILFPARPGHVRYHSEEFIYLDHDEQCNIKAIVAQDERKALQWATSVLIPDVEFWRVKESGVDTIYGFAEWFDVEEWFVRLKIGYLRMKAREDGQRLKWRDIIRRV
jgi:hypothetical protein